jgi:hypothetical protein
MLKTETNILPALPYLESIGSLKAVFHFKRIVS